MTIFYLIKVRLLYFFGASENIPFLKSLKSTPTEKQTDVVLKPSKKGVIITTSREHGSAGKQILRASYRQLNRHSRLGGNYLKLPEAK